MNECEVVLRLAFLANEQCTKAIVPTAGALDDRATRFALVHGTKHNRRLTALSLLANVERNAPVTHRPHAIRIVVSFIKAEMLGPTWSARCSQHDSVERRSEHSLVVQSVDSVHEGAERLRNRRRGHDELSDELSGGCVGYVVVP